MEHIFYYVKYNARRDYNTLVVNAMKELQGKYAGVFSFEGNEEGIALRWMWACLCDLSLNGKIEVIWRVIFAIKPKWIYEE